MLTLVADASSLIAAIKSGLLPLLPAHCERVILSPTGVEVLIAGGWIEALVTAEIEPLVEVVSLTQADEALAAELAAAMAAQDGAAHPGAAEALALLSRADLGATLFLSEEPVARSVAQARDIAAQHFAALIGNEPPQESGALPAAPTAASMRVLPRTIELDDESAALLDALLAQGIGQDAGEVVRRALRGLASALA